MNNDTPADAMQLKPCPFFHVIKIDGGIFGIRDQGTSMSFPWSESRNDTKDLCESLNSAMEFAFAHRTTSLSAQDWRKHTALLQVKAFVDEMIEGQYNCSPHQYFMAAQGRAIDLKPVIDAAVATDPAPSLAAQDGLVERVARALCELHIRDVRRHDTTPERLEEMLQAAVDFNWRGFVPQAQAALASIEVKS